VRDCGNLDVIADDMALDRPYFLWWANATVGDLRRHLSSESTEERAYWLGALLREANTRDVWLYTAPEEIRSIWPALARHLGNSRAMWIYLLEIPTGRAADVA